MSLFLLLRRRWRVALWIVLMIVFMFDAVAYLGIIHFKTGGPTFFESSSESHFSLQDGRKTHDKNSSKFIAPNYVDWDNKVVKLDISRQFTDKDSKSQISEQHKGHTNNSDHIDSKVENFKEKRNRNPKFNVNNTSVLLSQTDNVTRRHVRGQGYGSRANYSLPDVEKFVARFQEKYSSSHFSVNSKEKYTELLKRFKGMRKKGSRLPKYINNKGKWSWEKFHYGIHQHFLYEPDDVYLGKLLRDLGTNEIISVEQKEGGTQIKLIITFEDEGQALFKPMRYGRAQETLPDHFYFADFERHNAEIAAFHLDIVLGFNRVPPTIGRLLNVSEDIQLVCDTKLEKTFFVSPAGNLCFHGSCSYYCDSSHPVCGHPMMLEGSLAAFLPPTDMASRKTWRNPWKRSYSKHRKAYWETHDDLCEQVKEKHPYNEGRRLLDILDMSVFDFLTGNLDRHHYETFKDFGNDTFLLHLDNGRAFGKSKYDCTSCLAPVQQCCMIRLCTVTKLIKLYVGPNSLSQMMRSSLASDHLNPILIEPHLDALDRRVSKILHVLQACIVNGKPWDEVIIDDGIRVCLGFPILSPIGLGTDLTSLVIKGCLKLVEFELHTPFPAFIISETNILPLDYRDPYLC